jgi:GST-like protein
MIDLYGMSSPNVLKVVLALEEMALPYTVKHVNMMAGQQYTPDFRAINPNGRVPAIVDLDGPGGKPFAVFESGAIMMYLAEKSGKFWPIDMRERHTVIQWLMFQMGGVGPMSGQFVHFSRAAPQEGNEYARNRYFTEIHRLYGVLDTRLGEAAYMAGDNYSIADMATWPWARNQELLKLDNYADYPNLARWVNAIAGRPAAQRMIAKEAEIRTEDGKAFANATPDAMDRFFGRGKYARVLA